MPPRIFVSSIVEGFEEYRQAAREAIEAAGCKPILVNEDFPAVAASPRNACLDAVRSCDVYVGVLGARAGFISPSGQTVVEEEYNEARRRGLPILIFIQEEIEREERQDQLVRRISEFVSGAYRRTFLTATELSAEIEHALGVLDVHAPEDQEEAAAAVDARLRERLRLPGDPVAVSVSMKSIRSEEVIDPRHLESISEVILETGHASGVRLFRYELGYRREAQNGHVLVVADPAGFREGHGIAAVELSEAGLLHVEASVGHVTEPGIMTGMSGLVLHEEDLGQQLNRIFAFANAILREIDEFERHHTLVYNASLRNAGYRRIVRDFPPSTSVNMGMGTEDPLLAHSAPRRITRSGLSHPDDEIDRTIVRFRQRLNR